MTTLFTMQEDICGINAIIVSVWGGSYICQGQKGWENVHTAAREHKEEKRGWFCIWFGFIVSFRFVKIKAFMPNKPDNNKRKKREWKEHKIPYSNIYFYKNKC